MKSTSAALALIVAVAGLFAVVLGPVGAYFGLLPPILGFGVLALGLLVGGWLSLLLGLFAVWRTRGGRLTGRSRALFATATGIALLGTGVVLGASGRDVPPIHDITTTPMNAPAFTATASLPEMGEVDYSYPHGGSDVTDQQLAAYPDLKPLDLNLDAASAFAKAQTVAADLGWEQTAADDVQHHLEAAHRTSIFRFVDDIAVDIEATSPTTSRVHVRSRSRVGQSDLGANAKRIRSFLTALQG